jgi:high affinity Mn2+ porin
MKLTFSDIARGVFLGALANAAPLACWAQLAVSGPFALGAQATMTTQFHPAFHAEAAGANSMDRGARGATTNDVSGFLGLDLGAAGEVWVDLEADQGFGLSNTLGAAGFPSGEAYKIGKNSPYVRTQRWFWRESLDLGGETTPLEAGQMNFARHPAADRLVVTLGKFSVTDIFDQNRFAHDPRSDFLNWTLIDAGSFDYAADAWGYSEGGAAELYLGSRVARLGLFALSREPNGKALDASFGQASLVGELEQDFGSADRPGALRATIYANRGRMGSYAQALAYARLHGGPPSTADVRTYASRVGVSLSFDQSLGEGWGVFARAGSAAGDRETYEFTDADASVSFGASRAFKGLSGADLVGVGLVDNHASSRLRAYLAAGGLGLLIGDGSLRKADDEHIAEAFWRTNLSPWAAMTLDAQLIDHPAYNGARGPISVLGVRLHLQK